MRKRVHSVRPELNITSMLDVVFNLVFFFVLIANFAGAERLPMDVPTFDDSLAREPTEPNKVVINILPNKTDAEVQADLAQGKRAVVGVGEIVFGATHLKPGETREVSEGGQKKVEDALTSLLKDEVKRDKRVLMSIRADKSIMYAEFPPILQKIADAGVTKINIVATATAK
jgi:biopolymer transport protein ExbD